MPVADPRQTFEEVRRDVEAVLVGARLRRRPYYRFSLNGPSRPTDPRQLSLARRAAMGRVSRTRVGFSSPLT